MEKLEPVFPVGNFREGLNATWLPSYGPEMRGGTANAGVILSFNQIGSPVVDRPDVLIATTNIIVLTLFFLVFDIIDVATLKEIIPLSIKKKEYLDINLKALEAAIEYYNKNF